MLHVFLKNSLALEGRRPFPPQALASRANRARADGALGGRGTCAAHVAHCRHAGSRARKRAHVVCKWFDEKYKEGSAECVAKIEEAGRIRKNALELFSKRKKRSTN